MSIRELMLWTAYLSVWMTVVSLPGGSAIFVFIVLTWITLAIAIHKFISSEIALLYLVATTIVTAVLPVLSVTSRGPRAYEFVLGFVVGTLFGALIWFTIRAVAELNQSLDARRQGVTKLSQP
jgi:Na+/phosphate symporter